MSQLRAPSPQKSCLSWSTNGPQPACLGCITADSNASTGYFAFSVFHQFGECALRSTLTPISRRTLDSAHFWHRVRLLRVSCRSNTAEAGAPLGLSASLGAVRRSLRSAVQGLCSSHFSVPSKWTPSLPPLVFIGGKRIRIATSRGDSCGSRNGPTFT